MLSIRRFEPKDHPEVLRLHRIALQQVGADLGPGPWDDDLRSAAAITSCYLDTGGEFLVGLISGRIVAMAAFRLTGGGAAEVNRMRVDPEFQRRGYGRAILSRLENCAREIGVSTLNLDTTTLQEAAIGLYLKSGYIETGRHHVETRRHLGNFEEILFQKRI
jgi:GNAT superfamily N-acetyltransferase